MTRSAARQFLLALAISVVGIVSFHVRVEANSAALWGCVNQWSSCNQTYPDLRWYCGNNAADCITNISWQVQMLECDAWNYCNWDCNAAYLACMQAADGDGDMEMLCSEANPSCLSACGPNNCS